MLDYRAYLIDEQGRFIRSEGFLAADDEAALAIAEVWAAGRRFELWNRSRAVLTWPRDGGPADGPQTPA